MGLQIRMLKLLQWRIVIVHRHPLQHLPRNGRASPCEIASVLPALLLPSLANQELIAPPSKSTHVQDVHVHHFRSTENQTISCRRGGNCRVLRLSRNNQLKIVIAAQSARSPTRTSALPQRRGRRNKQLGIVTG